MIPLLLLIGSCGFFKVVEAPKDLPKVSAQWFAKSSNHALVNIEGDPLPHLFFDVKPNFSSNHQEVNVVITTPEGARNAFEVDVVSGQRYFSHAFCEHKDIWKKYSKSLDYPPFSVGVVPRVLDQLGQPQKVVVWSNRSQIFRKYPSSSHRVRLVGAYVENICFEGNCIGQIRWPSRLVFLAIDVDDKEYSTVSTLLDFEGLVDWKKAKAYLENMNGHNVFGKSYFPSTRIGDLVNLNDALEYFKKRSIFFKEGELSQIQKSCHTLYDRFLSEVSALKEEDKPAQTIKELDAKIALHNKLRKEGKPIGFGNRFKSFTKKFYKEFSTCEKFIYHGNINEDVNSFWTLSHVGVYYKLHREGHFFNCRNRVWQKNFLSNDDRQIFAIEKDIDFCTEKDLDLAMHNLPDYLSSLKSEAEFFKFLDYDNHSFGSHQKIYNWIKFKNRRFDCSNDPNEDIVKNTKIFPEDAKWENKHTKDLADKMKIIY